LKNRYYSQIWQTRKFMNPAIRTVNAFDPAGSVAPDYRAPDGTDPRNDKVFVWGRPNFAGTGANGRDARLYFMVVDMPQGSVTPPFAWKPQYFSGIVDRRPQFSPNPADARALDLSSNGPDRTVETWDVVGQMTVSFIEPLGRWVMFYGGDLPQEAADIILGPESEMARDPSGSIHVRVANEPWGPWSAPEPLLKARASSAEPAVAAAERAPFGILHSSECNGSGCAPNETAFPADERGRLYAPNIIEPWTEVRSDPPAVDIYWNVSTWAPYQVVLMKSRFALPVRRSAPATE
jgi:hypothetical protein